MNRIVHQGTKGAFSYLTALKEYGPEQVYFAVSSFKDAFDMLQNKEADYAVLPIENSLVGSIYENYDLLNQYDVCIAAEHFIPIEHCLLANQGVRIDKIKKVLSHPKALEQCSGYFQRHPWIEAVSFMDTAGAAKEIAARKDPSCAAIASAEACELYGLEVLEQGIEDDPSNYTRFVTISNEEMLIADANKFSIIVNLNHNPGALSTILQKFAREGMNLTKIESRPMRGSPFEYHFYIDFEFGGCEKERVTALMDEVNELVIKLKIIGFYKGNKLWMN